MLVNDFIYYNFSFLPKLEILSFQHYQAQIWVLLDPETLWLQRILRQSQVLASLLLVGNGAKGTLENSDGMLLELIPSCASSRHEAQIPMVFSAIQ